MPLWDSPGCARRAAPPKAEPLRPESLYSHSQISTGHSCLLSSLPHTRKSSALLAGSM